MSDDIVPLRVILFLLILTSSSSLLPHLPYKLLTEFSRDPDSFLSSREKSVYVLCLWTAVPNGQTSYSSFQAVQWLYSLCTSCQTWSEVTISSKRGEESGTTKKKKEIKKESDDEEERERPDQPIFCSSLNQVLHTIRWCGDGERRPGGREWEREVTSEFFDQSPRRSDEIRKKGKS